MLRFSNLSYFTDSSAHATVGQKSQLSCDQLQVWKITSVGKREDTYKHGRINKGKKSHMLSTVIRTVIKELNRSFLFFCLNI